MDKIENIEYEYLSQTLEALKSIVGELSEKTENSISEITEFNKYLWENIDAMDIEERILGITSNEQYADITNSSLRKIRSLKKSLNSPYFGRITFVPNEEKITQNNDIYIGINTIMDDKGFYVFDWRTPIATLFYNGKFGPVSYKAPKGIVEGKLTGKRQYKIVNGKLKRVVDTELHLDDDALQEALRRATSDKMRDIVTTIQKEQNEIIRNTKSNSLIVQGGAGSGKTSVALHRLAYLLYQDKKANSNNMLIFSPNDVFSKYISGVLPELGEENVLQTTISDFASSYIKGYDHLETFTEFISRYYDGNNITDEQKELYKFKFSKEYKEALDEYIKRINQEFYFKDYVKAKGQSFDNGYMTKMLRNLGNMQISDKIDELAKSICEYLKVPYKSNRDLIRKSLKKQLEPKLNFKNLYNGFLSSEEFVSRFGKTDKIKGTSTLEYPDILGMLYLQFELYGYPKNDIIRHLVIDEVQDYSPLQIEMLRKIFSGATFTILGDVNQTINPYFKYNSLEELVPILGKDSEYFELNKSYRSSPEITEYTNSLIGSENEAARTSGDIPVLVKEVPKESLYTELVSDILTMKENGLSRIAIVTRSNNEARAIYEGLKDDVTELSIVSDEGETYTTDTLVVPATISKGLEFDAVISYNNQDNPYKEDDKYLYYVACTRAQHELVVYNEPKDIKKKVLRKEDSND